MGTCALLYLSYYLWEGEHKFNKVRAGDIQVERTRQKEKRNNNMNNEQMGRIDSLQYEVVN